jgi:Outer membrane lipoprotein carrier protein LolA-like
MRGAATVIGLLLLAAGWLASRALAAGSSAPVSLGELLRGFARQPSARAHFQETQHLAVLTRPLVSEGTLIYRAPDYLEQRVSRPRAQDMILDHGKLTLQIGRHRHTVALADYPQLAPLLDSLRATLAGDQAALEQRFTARLTGAQAHWQLQLTPRDPALASLIRSILLQGEAAQIHSMQILQVNGDEAQLRIEPLPEPPANTP